MRGFLASSIAVTCTAALAFPLTLPAAAALDRPPPTTKKTTASAAHAAAHAAEQVADRASESYVPGSTQSLPLEPLARDRAASGDPEQGLLRRDVGRFSLIGVVWDDPDTELLSRVQVRTRSTVTGDWSGWQDVETHADHGADPGTAERTSGRVRGATAPLWVGESDGVEVRVQAESGADDGAQDGARGRRDGVPNTAASSAFPPGLRVELVDPGDDAPPAGGPGNGLGAGALRDAATAAASAVNADVAPLGADEIPALNRPGAEQGLSGQPFSAQTAQPATGPYIGPRPRIVTRSGWGADEQLREEEFIYTSKVKAAFVHHTATGNNYSCSQAPSLIRSIYRYHVKSMGWRDIGYNFLIDKCGNIYEGRAGGVTKPVMGAHTLGFNTDSMGVAVIGSYDSAKPSSTAVTAIARLTAWKLGLYGMNPLGTTYLKSGGGNLYEKGQNVRLNVISGHRDGFATECPGQQLYGKLGAARSAAARFQGRTAAEPGG